jgi:tRNA dimethylallyltransferase
MLYLKAFREGLSAMPGADREFRAQLRLEAADVGWEALFDRLAAVDPVAAAKIHPNNAPRIERALEVFVLTGQPISRFWESGAGQSAQQRLGAELVEFAIHPADRAALHARVEQRLDAMLEAGFVSEVAGLRARGDLTCGLPALRAVGYRQIWEHLEGGSSESRMRDRVLAATRQFAKRQLTWLRGWRLEALEWGDSARIAGRIAVSARLAIS